MDTAKDHPHNVEYTKQLQKHLTALVQRALNNLAPAHIGTGSGSCPVGFNRREVVRDKSGQTKIVLGRNPSVLTDREVQVLKLERADRKELAAVLFAYATHSTSLGPRNHFISGDIHGLAEQFLETYLDGGVVAPGFAGASGNIDPWFRVRPSFNTDNGWIPEPVLQGTMLGEEVAHVLTTIDRTIIGSPVRSNIKTVQLPGKSRDDQQGETDGSTQPFNISVGRVGEVAFVGLSGEVFNEIGQAIKTASPFPHTFIITHCNGASGYVPTRSSYPEGGYEIRTSPFAPGADELLIKTSVEMLKELREAAGSKQ